MKKKEPQTDAEKIRLIESRLKASETIIRLEIITVESCKKMLSALQKEPIFQTFKEELDNAKLEIHKKDFGTF